MRVRTHHRLLYHLLKSHFLMIRINCFFQANEGQYDAALQAALALTAASQKHAGCVSYDVFESGTRSDIFMFCETWSDADALAAHAATEDFKTYVAQLESLGKMKLERFEF